MRLTAYSKLMMEIKFLLREDKEMANWRSVASGKFAIIIYAKSQHKAQRFYNNAGIVDCICIVGFYFILS